DPQGSVKQLSRTATLGSLVTLDASGSTDADGDALSTSWQVMEVPQGSTIAQTQGSGSSFRLTMDKLGTFRVRSLTADAKGGVATTEVNITVNNRAPQGVLAIYAPPTANQSTSDFTTPLGYQVFLNGGGSKDADGDPLTYAWTLVSQPQGSKLGLTSNNAAALAITPDMLGTYKLKLTVTDSKGAQGENLLTLVVDNTRPVANIDSNATPLAVANAPSARLLAGVQVLLRGSNSHDDDGDTLKFAWDIVSRPAGSVVGLSAYDKADVTVTPDRDGAYVFKLKVTDLKGAYSESQVELVVGGALPVVTLDRTRIMATVGESVGLNALASLGASVNGTTASYAWSLDSAPAGSALTLAPNTTNSQTLVPDVAGSYIVSVTATAGKLSATASAVVVAEKSWAGAFALDFRPEKVVYNRAQDLVVMTVSAPSPAVKIVDLIANSVFSVPLPKAINGISVSPDGQRMAVLHDALVSYIDLRKGALIRNVSYSGNRNVGNLTNGGRIYIPGDGSQVIDLNTGTPVLNPAGDIYWYGDSFYNASGLSSVYADKINKFFYIESGLSPADIRYQEIDQVTGKFVAGSDSPYHGDYPMSGPLWLNEDQTLVFTGVGTMFNTSDLRYAGTLQDVAGALSFSHSKVNNEIIAVVSGYTGSYYYGNQTSVLLPSYRRFVGTYQSRVDDVQLPLIDGQQSYALQAFHTGAGKPVILVQVGSTTPGAAAASFHLVYR
ncbi:MAG: hypothetical protein RI920_1420, partial [Pseudomonadota bacterium]